MPRNGMVSYSGIPLLLVFLVSFPFWSKDHGSCSPYSVFEFLIT